MDEIHGLYSYTFSHISSTYIGAHFPSVRWSQAGKQVQYSMNGETQILKATTMTVYDGAGQSLYYYVTQTYDPAVVLAPDSSYSGMPSENLRFMLSGSTLRLVDHLNNIYPMQSMSAGLLSDGNLRGVATAASATAYANGEVVTAAALEDCRIYMASGISDVPTPEGVAYSPETPSPGSVVTVTIIPSSNLREDLSPIKYEVQYTVNGSGRWTTVTTAASTTASVTVPSNATSFQVRVRAVDDTGFQDSTYVYGPAISNGAPSAPVSVSIPDVVSPNESFSIRWGASTDPDGNLSGYEVQRACDGGSVWTTVISSTSETSLSDTVERGRTSVQYRVRAKDAGGLASAWTYSNTAAIQNAQAPAAPDSVTIPGTVDAGEPFTVRWGAATDPDGDLSGYEVQRAYDGGSSWTTVTSSTAETSVSDAVDKGHTSVQYRVRARDAAGLTSAWTYSNTAAIHVAQPPAAPGSVTIPGTVYPGHSFAVRWGASTDPDGDLSAYEVQRAYNGGSSWTDVTTSARGTSVSTTVARGYTSVRYRVRARDAGGLTSAWAYSNAASVSNIGSYVGISDKARRVAKWYVSVDGRARRVVRGYVGVNGTARLFLDAPIDKTGKDLVGTARAGISKIWKGAD